MRITAGELGGRTLKVPKGGVRPTQDKVRQAVFSSLGAAVGGARVLDLFAGTGAMGIEAWSRGAAEVTWVESDRRAFAVLQENVTTLCGAEAARRCRCADALRFLEQEAGGPFDFVFADPPYDRSGDARWLEKTLLALGSGPMLTPAGLLVFEQAAGMPPLEAAGWRLVRDRTYGEARIIIYGRDAGF